MAASTDLLIRMRADGKQAISEFGRVEGAMGKLRRGVGRAATAGAAALVGVAAAGVKEFASFQRGMNEVFTLLPQISGEAMTKMSEQVKDLAVDMGVLPEEVVPALYQAISAGVPEKNVFGFLETATELSIAGVTDLETAVDGLTTITNAYGVENVSAQEAADSLFTAMKLGKTTVGEMSASLFQVVPAAAAAGITIDEVAAGLAAITAQGTPTRVAATQMRQAIVELGKAGSIAFDVFKEATGQTFPQFIKGGGTLQDALQILSEVAMASGGTISDMFGSVEAGMAALTLTSDTGAAAWGSNMDEMANKTGAVGEGFETMNQGIARGWDRISAITSVALIEIGEALAPVVEDFLEGFGEQIPGAAAKLGDAFAALVGFVDRAGTGFGIVKDGFDGMNSAARGAAGGLGAVSVAMLLIMSHPIIAFLGLVAVALSEIGSNAQSAEGFGKEFTENMDEMSTAAGALTQTLRNRDDFEAFQDLLQRAGSSVDEVVRAMLLGEPGLRSFMGSMTDAADSYSISTLELSLLKRVLELMGPEVENVIAWFDTLAASERAAVADTVLLAKAAELAGGAVGDMTFDEIIAELGDFGDAAEETVSIVIGAFRELPDQVEKSLSEMEELLLANAEATINWENNLQTLRDLGFGALATEMEALDSTWNDTVENMINNATDLHQMEAILDAVSLQLNFGIEFDVALHAAQLFLFHQGLQAWLAANPLVIPTIQGPIPPTPSPPFIPGTGLGDPTGIFHHGGIIPGRTGQEVMVRALAGEEVLPIGQAGRGGGLTVQVFVEGNVHTEEDLAEALRDRLLGRDIDGSAGISVTA